MIKAGSKKKFTKSNNVTPQKKEVYRAVVTAKGLNVRTWAGSENQCCSFSPLSQGDIVSVCDAILSDDNKPWAYICYQGHYGFVNAKYLELIPEKAVAFLDLLESYHLYIKDHAGYFDYDYDSDMDSFSKAKDKVKHKKMVYITCVVPIRWALKALGIKRADGKSLLVAYNGTFATTFTGGMKKSFNRITKGGAVGKTVVQAVDRGLLKAGDTLCFEGYTHTFVYSGEGYICYDGGRASMKDGHYKGIRCDYSKHNANRKISEVIRWKEG